MDMSIDDRMKMYEKATQPMRYERDDILVIRLDGRGFSKFTKKMEKPFDSNFTYAMHETAKHLFKQSNALYAYHQSDEITLILANDNPKGDFLFGGKLQKLTSTLASAATVKFYSEISKTVDCSSNLPTFDCRVFKVPSKIEAANAVLWRFQDAVRNSKSMLGCAYLSHKEMHKKSTDEVCEELKSRFNVDWNDVKPKFKIGSSFKREYYINDSAALRSRVGCFYENLSELNIESLVSFIFEERDDVF